MLKYFLGFYLIFISLYPQPIEITALRLKYHLAFASVDIENQRFLLLVDTGSSASISLNKRLTQHLANIYTGNRTSFARANGDRFESEEILIPELKIGTHSWKNVLGREDGEWLDQGALKKDGILGKGLLQNFCLLFDLPNDKLIFSKESKEIEDLGYSFIDYTVTAFKNEAVGIVIDALVDYVPCKLLLDSGSSHTILKQSFLEKNNLKKIDSITVCDSHIPREEMLVLDLPEPQEVDGIIGIGFFDTHLILIDFEKNVIKTRHFLLIY